MSKECRRHLVMLGIGGIGMFGDGACRHLLRERGIVFRIAAGKPRRGARTQPLDRSTDHEIGQRHPFGGADYSGYEAHVTTPFCGGSGESTSHSPAKAA